MVETIHLSVLNDMENEKNHTLTASPYAMLIEAENTMLLQYGLYLIDAKLC